MNSSDGFCQNLREEKILIQSTLGRAEVSRVALAVSLVREEAPCGRRAMCGSRRIRLKLPLWERLNV
jgi:hypothetical protein